MKSIEGVALDNVKEVYSGPEGDLWELIMGEQIHIGGFASSMALAEKAGIGEGMGGVDLCCCNGGGMRFLVMFRNVASMQGVDATEKVVSRGKDYMGPLTSLGPMNRGQLDALITDCSLQELALMRNGLGECRPGLALPSLLELIQRVKIIHVVGRQVLLL